MYPTADPGGRRDDPREAGRRRDGRGANLDPREAPRGSRIEARVGPARGSRSERVEGAGGSWEFHNILGLLGSLPPLT